MNTLKILRIVAFTEGMSYLILLFYRYYMNMTEYIKEIGMTHGLLFVAYIVLVLMAMFEHKWNAKTTLISLLLSLIPFGTFYADKKYFR